MTQKFILEQHQLGFQKLFSKSLTFIRFLQMKATFMGKDFYKD